MAASGTYAYDPTVAALMDRAFARAGIAPESIGQQHIVAAKEALNLLQIELALDAPDAKFREVQESTALASGTATITLPAGTIDVIDIVVKKSGGNDIPIIRSTREDYLNNPTKTSTGLPSQWHVDHTTLNAPYIQFWPVPDAALTVTYDRLRWMQDVDTLSDTFDARKNWLPTIINGLAAGLALEFNAEKFGLLDGLYNRSKDLAKRGTAGRGTVVLSGRGFGRSRRRRM